MEGIFTGSLSLYGEDSGTRRPQPSTAETSTTGMAEVGQRGSSRRAEAWSEERTFLAAHGMDEGTEGKARKELRMMLRRWNLHGGATNS